MYIANTYGSGNLDDAKAGGIVGCIVPDFSGTVSVEYSVYNVLKSLWVMDDPGTHLAHFSVNMGNSGDLDDIRGRLYYSGGIQQWSNSTWALNATDQLPILRYKEWERALH